MHDKFLSPRIALDQPTAKLEQALNHGAQLLARVSLKTWQFLVILLLVLWISHSLARLFWLIIPEPQIVPAAVALTAPSSGGMEAQSVNIQELKALQIFGEAQQATSAESAVTATPAIENETVDTKLNLVLVGVIASSEESSGRAIIAANGQQDVYGPGAELPVGKGVTLAKVLDTRAILNNNGVFESLWLYQENDGSRSRVTINYPAPDQTASRSWPDESDTLADNQPPAMFADRNQGSEMRGPAENDVSAEISRNISDVVAMSIHREGGQVVGYKIRPGRDAEQFTALGLQPDDIVTAVNGMPLNNPGKIMEIYKNMSNATSANLEIKRGGSVLSVDVVLQQ